MKRLYTFAIILFLSVQISAQYNCQYTKSLKSAAAATPPINNNAKSDTLDILHYDLDMDMTLIQNSLLRATAELTIVAKQNNISTVNLDFINLHIDSVKLNNTAHCTHNFSSGPQFLISLPQTFNAGDTFTLSVFYYGAPVKDASGWGGFHLSSPYFFNLGVGFAANPHTFGRAWFPCYDNFVEKSTYSFHVKTSNGRTAYCNGLLTSLDTTTFGGDTVVSYWEQTDPIPSYLAAIAISNYEVLESTHNGMPFWLIARPGDTSNMQGSFANLHNIYDGFVSRFGPYFWQKVGFTVTTTGAMEHATSIHYPLSSVNGNLQSQDLIAHELAHHWFGNLVTCETAGDMWINEGMAEYMSHQFEEDLNGYGTYLQRVVDNHFYVINQAHIADDGYRALYNLPNELTYGVHTYQKGAMVGHNLRGYLGDSAFFNGLTTLLNNNKYGNLSSAQFRDQLGTITGYDLTSFFNDWVFDAGYPDFNIDSMHVFYNAIPEPRTAIRVSQRMLATTKRFTNVPLTITLHDDLGNHWENHVLFEDDDTTFYFVTPSEPTWATINEDNRVLIGVTALDQKLNASQSYSNTKAMIDVNVTSLSDSARLRVEHHWTGPSTTGNENFRVSSARYWRVTGQLPVSYQANARLDYTSSAANAFLDEDLLANGEDSLILVYRQDATEEWREFGFYHKDYLGSPSNKFGRIYIHSLIRGEYAFANGVSAFSIAENTHSPQNINLFPNPSTDSVTITFNELENETEWFIRDISGKTQQAGNLPAHSTSIELEVHELTAGTYFFCSGKNVVKFVVQ